MVKERSPAKVPKPRTSEVNGISRPLAPAAPQFGVTSFPGSPLAHQTPRSAAPKDKDEHLFNTNRARPEHHRDDRSKHPHWDGVKYAAKDLASMGKKVGEFTNTENKYAPPPGNAVSLRNPMVSTAPQYLNQPVPKPMYGTMGTGFQSVNPASNVIDLTGSRCNYTPVADPYTYIDPAKAQEDLKALLEGVMEDEDDAPKTRARKKKQVDELTSKLKELQVAEDQAIESDEEDDGTVEGIKVKLIPHQVEGLGWMTGRELGTSKKGRVPKGGILADDMGLGKTLQSISLILTNPRPKVDDETFTKRKLPIGLEKCTLVVAPLALIRQWEVEIKDKVENSHALRVIVHHGPQRTKRFQDLKKYDVVITTYQILVSEFGGSSKDKDGIKVGCFGLHWYRVVLDEAHTIKNRNAKATQACYALRSQYRWCLTGTPMQNNLDELQSLIKFLRIAPYDDLKEWKDQIDRPMKNGRGDLAIKRLRAYLKIFMKRRTKEILKKEGALNPGGKASAPGAASTTGFRVTERKIVKVFAAFSDEERRFYERLEQRTDASMEAMMRGEKVNYASALVLLLRLRQACNHPKLVAGKLGKDTDALAAETVNAKLKSAPSEMDDMADMFGNLGVGSKKCEVCQLELGETAVSDGAIRCLDCEADLEAVSKKRVKKDKKKKHKHRKEKESASQAIRKPRNRAVIEDSDDEEEGEWLVGERHQGSTNLGKAGGIKDENAEGGGEWLNSDDDTLPGIGEIQSSQTKQEDTESDDGTSFGSDLDSASVSEVEDEFQSDSDEGAQLATIITSTKISHLVKILDKEVDDHKFIVFSQFTSMLDLIEPFLRQKGFKFARYDGSMKNDLREASLSKLRNDKNCRILLCSLKCGSLGLNLTAATRVVILEPFWNPFVEEQAIDRVHRLTQKIDVIVYRITIKDSVEERILELQEKKRELANQTIEGGKGGAGKLGMKEILQLFRRDAEHSHPVSASTFDPTKPKILKEVSTSSQSSSRETSEPHRVTTPGAGRSGSAKEDPMYGRRW
ncbi:SNF2 family N-terminal domain-containing protein [Calycina marina]|uniref:SNF2 family N-terminal domain-containing protein n=1 Tax=Calycina marina TaxID=1763456 RepID=A0A9P8CEW2_9HELO|nr:SNF2 family N-terminal domain-containing protein [Calycina marina]